MLSHRAICIYILCSLLLLLFMIYFLNLYLSLCPLLLSFSKYIVCSFIASLSCWLLFFWFHTFLFLCFLVSMYLGKHDILFIWFLVCFIIRIAACSFIILLTLWKISWMFENMYLVKCELLNMKNRKHVNLKDIKSEY